MMIISRNVKIENEAKESFIYFLRKNFQLHRDFYHLVTIGNQEKFQVQYGAISFNDRKAGIPFTLFNIYHEDYCDIIDFEIPKGQRKKGNGKKLYKSIEELAKQYKCKKIILTPSGDGEKFWPKMGFTEKSYVGIGRIIS